MLFEIEFREELVPIFHVYIQKFEHSILSTEN